VPGFLNMQPSRDLANWWGCRDLPNTSSTEVPYSLALMEAVDLVSRKWMADQHFSKEKSDEFWGARKNCPNTKPNGPHYRARPLNGVWATAPYLHNGSVPSLWWLLTPTAERPQQFCMGFRDFDPQQVGFRVEANETPSCRSGETLFSTTRPDGSPIHGNSNRGHSLEAKPGESAHDHKSGVIGRLLS